MIDGDVEEELNEELLNVSEYLYEHAEDDGFCWILGVSDGKMCMERIEWNHGEDVLAYERNGEQFAWYTSSYDQIYGIVELEYTKDGKLY